MEEINKLKEQESALYFTCPICNKRTPFYHSVTEDVEGETIGGSTEWQGRWIIVNKTKRVYRVRICRECTKRREITRKIILWLFLVIIPFVHGVLSAIMHSSVGMFFKAFLGIAFLDAIIAVILLLILVPKPDIKKAAKGNAIANGLF